MSLFNLTINLLEGVILAGFASFFFEIKNKYKFIIFVGIVISLEITISNLVNNYDWILIFVIITTLSIALTLVGKSFFTSFFISSVFSIVLLCCNGISLFIISFVFKVDIKELTIGINQGLFNYAIVLSKVLLVMILFCIYKNKVTTKKNLELRQWWMYAVIIFILLLLSIIILEIIMLGNFKFFTMGVALILIIIAIILIIVLFYKTIKENERLIRITTEIDKTKYREKSFKLLSSVNKDMDSVLHNSKYFLLSLKSELNTNDFIRIREMIDKRLEETLKLRPLSNSKNLLFDYNFNYILNKYELKKRNIKFMISLDRIDFIEDEIFINYINELLYSIKSDSKNRYLSFDLQNTKQFIMVKIIVKSDLEINLYWQSRLTLLKEQLCYNFLIKKYDDFLSISIVIPIEKNKK